MKSRSRYVPGTMLAVLLTFFAVPAGVRAAGEGRLLFGSDRGHLENENAIWRASADGSGLAKLTDNDCNNHPAPSPDGTKIAFDSTGCDDLDISAIYVMNADGGGLRKVPQTDMGTQPSWSPDGTRITFVKSTRYDEVDVMSADGHGSAVRVGPPTGTTQVSSLHWLTDGRIAFAGFPKEGPGGLYRADPATFATAKTATVSRDYDRIGWSADGAQVAFGTSGSRVHSDLPISDLYVMRADGSGRARVPTGSLDAQNPQWSPDGRSLVFESFIDYNQALGESDDHRQLARVNIDGSGLERLTIHDGDDTGATWAPRSATAARAATVRSRVIDTGRLLIKAARVRCGAHPQVLVTLRRLGLIRRRTSRVSVNGRPARTVPGSRTRLTLPIPAAPHAARLTVIERTSDGRRLTAKMTLRRCAR